VTDYSTAPNYSGATAANTSGTPLDDDRPDVEGKSLGELVGQVASDLSTLMRQELALAKAEVKEDVKQTGKAAGMLGGAGFAGYMVALFVSVAIMWALGNVMDLTWAALIVAVIWGIVGAILYSIGRKRLQQANLKPEQTVETLKEDVEWARNRRS
jgi:uncharacterized membrane protein YqjE